MQEWMKDKSYYYIVNSYSPPVFFYETKVSFYNVVDTPYSPLSISKICKGSILP